MARKKSTSPVNLLTLAAAVIIFAFFLPWIKFGGSYAGYEIPDLANTIGKLKSFKTWTGRLDINVYLVYSLFLVPVSAAAVVIFNLRGRNAKPAAWVAAVLPLAGFIYGFARRGMDVFSRIEIGGWLTMAAAGVMLLVLLNILKLPGRR